MASIQEIFGLSIPADRVQDVKIGDVDTGTKHYWAVDSGRYPEIVQYLMDQDPPPCKVRAVGSDGNVYGVPLFEYSDDMLVLAGIADTMIERTKELPTDTILIINFEDPPVTVEMRMPQAPYAPFTDPKNNKTSIGHLGIIHATARPPEWLNVEPVLHS